MSYTIALEYLLEDDDNVAAVRAHCQCSWEFECIGCPRAGEHGDCELAPVVVGHLLGHQSRRAEVLK